MSFISTIILSICLLDSLSLKVIKLWVGGGVEFYSYRIGNFKEITITLK